MYNPLSKLSKNRTAAKSEDAKSKDGEDSAEPKKEKSAPKAKAFGLRLGAKVEETPERVAVVARAMPTSEASWDYITALMESQPYLTGSGNAETFERIAEAHRRYSAANLVTPKYLKEVVEMRKNLVKLQWNHVDVQLSGPNTHSLIIVRYPRLNEDGMDVLRHFGWCFVHEICARQRAPLPALDPANLKDFEPKPRLRQNTLRLPAKPAVEEFDALSLSDLRTVVRKRSRGMSSDVE